MNQAHYHLMINHVPLFGIVTGTCLMLAGLILRNEVVKKTALYFFVISALVIVPTYTSGFGAEKVLKAFLPGMNTDVIEQHEEIAVLALGATAVLGIISLVCTILFWGQKPVKNVIAIIIVILSIATVVMIGFTANLGGKIRHPELKNSSGYR
ncbi:MAG: hypothetical protein N2487_00070 [Verrucomicrobiae bacterium]|nr:hypothetical protein [Verrucomicrobiae bacterium]